MSRFDLHPAHIDGIVNAGLQFDLLDPFEDPLPLRWMLLRQHRFNKGTRQQGNQSSDHALTMTDRVLHPLVVLRLLDCYEYQTSDTLGWATSPARRWVTRLRETVLSQLPAEATATVYHHMTPIPAYKLLDAY